MQESPIFTKVHELQLWLLQATRKFPREYRFTLAEEVIQQGFAVQRSLIAANIDRPRRAGRLQEADICLAHLKETLLLCFELGLWDAGQYRHVSQMAEEVGRLLGGWINSSAPR